MSTENHKRDLDSVYERSLNSKTDSAGGEEELGR